MSGYQDFLPTLRLQDTLALSPDGTLVAYADDADGQFNLVVRPLDGGPSRRLTSYVDAAVRRVAWHPDGRALVFEADTRGDEKTQVYEVSIAGGTPLPLTATPGTQYALAIRDPFVAGGRLLAYAGNDRIPGEQDVLILDRDTGGIRRISRPGGRLFAGAWSPCGTRLTIADWREGNSDHVVYVTGPEAELRRLTPLEGTATYWLGPWLPDGSAFLVRSDAGREFTGLAIVDAHSGELTWLDTPDRDVEHCALAGNGRILAWTLNVDGATRLRSRDLGTGADLPTPDLPPGVAANLALSPDGRSAVLHWCSATQPPNIYTVDLATGAWRAVTPARPVAACPKTMVEPERISYPAEDGRAIPAYLYRPAAGRERVGVVLAIHGGPAAQERGEYSLDGLFQYLVSQGVAVLAPNVRGSSGYGRTYRELSYRDWGGGDLGDFAAAVRYLRTQPWVAADRIGLYGRSYGGFAVLSCLARLPQLDWAVAVEACGPSNLLTFARSQPPTWRRKVAVLVGDPDTDADLLLARSPVTYADAIRAPLFVIQGANDPRVPRHESDQIVDRLRRRGIPVRYDVYPDEGHVFSRRENRTRERVDAAEFLLRHLRPSDI